MQWLLIQNVIYLMTVSFKYLLDVFPTFCISIDNNNNFYFNDNHHLEDILSVSQNICRKQGDAESGLIGSHVKWAMKNSSVFWNLR